MNRTLGPFGPVVAAASVAASDWFAVLGDRGPLVLAPSSSRGWFGGQTVVAFDPASTGEFIGNRGEALHQVGALLGHSMHAEDPELSVALLPYSGDISFAVYRHGLVLAYDGWRTWGDTNAEPLPTPAPQAPAAGPPLVYDGHSDFGQHAYGEAVEAVRSLILRGDVYVLNLTRRLFASVDLSVGELFSALTVRTPATMAAAWAGPEHGIVSCSPERFVSLTGHEARIEPVKGTRPRGADVAEDAALAEELRASDKERAEHVMIVDLERNDLGRVCAPGSISVDPLFEIETTGYCHQAVSTVCGLMRVEATVGDLLEATFPCGSVTGAPKIAAMHITEHLERSARGAYTGSLLVAVPGRLDSSVLIRTAEVAGGRLVYGTGGGVTIDSDPAEEWAESVLKTEPILGQVPAVSLKETCRAVGGRVPLWEWHRRRLENGGCGPALLQAADRLVTREAAQWADAATRRARLTVVVSPDGAVSADVSQRLSSLDVPNGPVAVRIDVRARPPLPARAAKPADRAYWDDAHRSAAALGAHQAVLVDEAGMVLDGSTATIWIAENGVLVTPPTPWAIPGVARAFVLDSAAAAGLTVRVEPLSWERFEAAEEAFLTNAFGGAVAIRDRRGPRFERVAALFADMWQNNRKS